MTRTLRTRTLRDIVIEEIRVSMARKNCRPAELARRLGVPDSWVSMRLSGKTGLSVDDIDRITEQLGIEPQVLFPGRRAEATPHERPSFGRPRDNRPPTRSTLRGLSVAA